MMTPFFLYPKLNLTEYKIMEMNFSNNASSISTLKPCYIDDDKKLIYIVPIPCEKLKICKSIDIHNENDFNTIPNKSGLYWIMTNEPINHCLNSGIKCPEKNNTGMKIIYNGSTDNLKGRIKEHLLRSDEKGGTGTQSGISIDILLNNIEIEQKISHIKCLWGEKKKTPKIIKDGKIKKINVKEELIENMYLTEEEKIYIENNKIIYFKNGINVMSDKHKKYNWQIYFLEIENHNIRDYIEIEWRKKNGVPVLCSYTSGR